VNDCSVGSIRIGFAPFHGHDDKFCRTVWDNSGTIIVNKGLLTLEKIYDKRICHDNM
jgi:hypothetical protein